MMIQLHILSTGGRGRYSLGKSGSPWLNNNVITHLPQSGWLVAQTTASYKLEKGPSSWQTNEQKAVAWQVEPGWIGGTLFPSAGSPVCISATLISGLTTSGASLTVSQHFPFTDEEIRTQKASVISPYLRALCTPSLTLRALFRLLKRIAIQNYSVLVFLYFISMSIPLPK